MYNALMPSVRHKPFALFKEHLGFIQEYVQNSHRWTTIKETRFDKAYINGERMVVVHLVVGHDHFHLALIRTPSHLRIGRLDRRTRDLAEGAENESTLHSNRVFAIGDFCHLSNNVIAAGVSWTSEVWLLPAQKVPKLGVECESLFQFSILEIVGISSPREVDVFPRLLPNDCAGCVENLIKTVPSIVQCAGNGANEVDRNGLNERDLEDAISSFRIEITARGERASFHPFSQSRARVLDVFTTESQCVLRELEKVHGH